LGIVQLTKYGFKTLVGAPINKTLSSIQELIETGFSNAYQRDTKKSQNSFAIESQISFFLNGSNFSLP
jgi:hypothetical protein